MRERGISTVPAILLAAAAGLVASVLMMDWMVVTVHTPGPDAVHFTAPIPLALPHLAAKMVPADVLEDATMPPELREQREAVLAAIGALAEAPDATLVAVDAPDARVRVTKQGPELKISVVADDATVSCTVPIRGVLRALEEWDWERADPELLFDVLAAAGNGNLLTVDAEGTRVVVNMW
jgi:hypothetical protein